MSELVVVPTQALAPTTIGQLRTLFDAAFDGDYGDDDWDHSVGGHHIMVTDEEGPLAHAAVVERTIEVDGVPWRSGYVESVATRPDRQGRGHGSAVMGRANELIRAGSELGVLATGAHRFYHRLGWNLWVGPTFVRTGGDLVRSRDADGAIMVLRFGRSSDLKLSGPIACEGRPGDDW